MTNSGKTKSGLTYRDAGVNIDAGNQLVENIKPAVQRTLRPEVLTGLGGFGGLFKLDLSGYRNPILVSGTDGVGTKLLLAQHLNRHDTIGQDLVAMCVNDILTCGAEPLYFLDYFATGKLRLETAETIIKGIAEGCVQAGCALIGGETAEMPGMYRAEDYDLAGFAVGIVDQSAILDNAKIRPGHRLIGLASSGPHSNGYSLIRKVLELSGADINSPFDNSSVGLGQALMAPTRIYVKPVLKLLEKHTIHGLAHITGGGLSENITRILPPDLGVEIGLNSWKRPAVFNWLQRAGSIDDAEMLRTFNCGIGMVMICPTDQTAAILASAKQLGESAWEIGQVNTTHPGTVHYSE